MPIILLIVDIFLCSIVFKKSEIGAIKSNIFKKCILLCAKVNILGVIIGFILKKKDFLYNYGYVAGYIGATFIISLFTGVLLGFLINYLIFHKKFKK